MALAIWLYLLAGRGAFWLAGERDEGTIAHAGRWPAIAAVIPARDEADCVGETVASLLRQDYPGAFIVILVDDQSRDGTAQVARDAAAALDASRPASRADRAALTGGLDRKVMGAASRHRSRRSDDAAAGLSPPHRCRYRLRAGRARCAGRAGAARGTVLTSLMVKLRCESLAERVFVSGFHFLFPDAVSV